MLGKLRIERIRIFRWRYVQGAKKISGKSIWLASPFLDAPFLDAQKTRRRGLLGHKETKVTKKAIVLHLSLCALCVSVASCFRKSGDRTLCWMKTGAMTKALAAGAQTQRFARGGLRLAPTAQAEPMLHFAVFG